VASSILAKVCANELPPIKDAPEGILQEVKQHLPLMPGLVETVKELKNHGWKVAIASGGFTYFAEVLQQKLGLVFYCRQSIRDY